jgi:hypothetical protein
VKIHVRVRLGDGPRDRRHHRSLPLCAVALPNDFSGGLKLSYGGISGISGVSGCSGLPVDALVDALIVVEIAIYGMAIEQPRGRFRATRSACQPTETSS